MVFSIRWIIACAIFSVVACRSDAPQNTAAAPLEPNSQLFSTSVVPGIGITHTHVPIAPISGPISIQDSGELCLQMNPSDREITASMTPSGCWGSGCFEIIKTDLRLWFTAEDAGSECAIARTKQLDCQLTESLTLRVSSLFLFAPHPGRLICARDCSGITPIENHIAAKSTSPTSVFFGEDQIGMFDPTNPIKQCFKSTEANLGRN